MEMIATLVLLALISPSIALAYQQGQRRWIVLSALAKNLDTGKEFEIDPGMPMSLAAVKTGLRLSFQCKSGNCGSCEFLLDGKVTRSCITKVPKKKSFTIMKKGKPGK